MDELTLVQKIAVWALPVLFAITVHEAAHGWMAKKLGDPTAFMLGRLTLNPLKHIDPIGTVVVPLALVALAGFVFGWAKPVPVAWQNLRNPRRDMALVALAGPLSNFLMAFIWAFIAKVGGWLVAAGVPGAEALMLVGLAGIFVNALLMVFNLLPLLPLDGGRVVASLLPGPMAYKFSRIEPYGLFILLGLLALGWLGVILWPLVQFVQGLVSAIVL